MGLESEGAKPFFVRISQKVANSISIGNLLPIHFIVKAEKEQAAFAITGKRI